MTVAPTSVRISLTTLRILLASSTNSTRTPSRRGPPLSHAEGSVMSHPRTSSDIALYRGRDAKTGQYCSHDEKGRGALVPLVVEDQIEEGAMNLQAAVVVDEA